MLALIRASSWITKKASYFIHGPAARLLATKGPPSAIVHATVYEAIYTFHCRNANLGNAELSEAKFVDAPLFVPFVTRPLLPRPLAEKVSLSFVCGGGDGRGVPVLDTAAVDCSS